MFRKLLVPVTAFLFTVTGASAFTGGAWLSDLSADDLGVTEAQKTALEEAFTLRQDVRVKAQDVIDDAGITTEQMREVHEAVRDARQGHREAVREAVENNDYTAFLTAIAETPIADTIDTEAEFEKFVEAHELMEEGDREGAREIMDELGIERGPGFGGKGMMRAGGGEGYGRGQGMGRGMGR